LEESTNLARDDLVMARRSPATFASSGQEAKGIEKKGRGNTAKYFWPYYKIFIEGGTPRRKIDRGNSLAVQCSV